MPKAYHNLNKWNATAMRGAFSAPQIGYVADTRGLCPAVIV